MKRFFALILAGIMCFSFAACGRVADSTAGENSPGYDNNATTGEPYHNEYGDGETLYPIENDGRWGYMNGRCEIVVEPQYDSAEDFNEGLGIVSQGNEWLVIDANGEVTGRLPGKAKKFCDGLALVEVDGKYGFADKEGNLVIAAQYIDACDFSEGLAAICERQSVSEKWGFINTNGEVVIPVEFSCDYGAYFSEGLAAVQLYGRYGYINRQGQWVIEPKYSLAYSFKEGRAEVMTGNLYDGDNWGFIDADGNVVIDIKYDLVYSFSDGLAAVKVDGLWGFVDRDGNMVVEPKFGGGGGYFTEGVGFVTASRKNFYSLIDKNGNFICDNSFGGGINISFKNGISKAQKDIYEGTWGYINTQGQFIWLNK